MTSPYLHEPTPAGAEIERLRGLVREMRDDLLGISAGISRAEARARGISVHTANLLKMINDDIGKVAARAESEL